MLSFMREQGIETTKHTGGQAGKPVELPGTMPQSQQYLTVTHKKQVRKSTYVLFVFFAIGLLCLWLMIKKSTPQSAAASIAADTQIEMMLAKLSGSSSEMFSSMDEISERFYKFAEVQQVKNEELIKNPFKSEVVLNNAWQASPLQMSNNSNTTEPGRAVTSQDLTGHMQLLSIMSDDNRRCCMIDDKILYAGDSMKGFTVKEIGNDFVKLESQGQPNEVNHGKIAAGTEIVLKLSE